MGCPIPIAMLDLGPTLLLPGAFNIFSAPELEGRRVGANDWRGIIEGREEPLEGFSPAIGGLLLLLLVKGTLLS